MNFFKPGDIVRLRPCRELLRDLPVWCYGMFDHEGYVVNSEESYDHCIVRFGRANRVMHCEWLEPVPDQQ